MGHTQDAESSAKRLCASFFRDETAQDLVEYVLLAALIGAGATITWEYILSSSIQTLYYTITQKLDTIFLGVRW